MIKKLLALVFTLFAFAAFASTEVNTATQAELDSVKGIGPAIATKIVDERKNGPFKDWADLVTRVKGVGNKNSAEFSAGGLTVNGAAMSGVPATSKAPPKTAAASKTTAVVTPAPATPMATPMATAPAATAAPAAGMSAADKKAAAKQEREDKKAAKKEAKAAKAASAAAAASAPARK